MTALRSALADMKGKLEGITARASFNGIIEGVAAPKGVTFSEGAVLGISGWWAKPGRREGSAILHLHGGWFKWEQRRHSAICCATSP
jgi:monoterpene epsilon-lactone hydrolase